MRTGFGRAACKRGFSHTRRKEVTILRRGPHQVLSSLIDTATPQFNKVLMPAGQRSSLHNNRLTIAMKPVAIIQHEEFLGPGSLQTVLQQEGVPLRLIRADQGQVLPEDAREFSGLVLLGSERNLSDNLPWMRAEQRLCSSALAHAVPVLGLAFGAQLLTVAAGGKVLPSTTPSYGWQHSWVTPHLSRLIAPPSELELFNAHAHSLELPPGAERVLFDKRCRNKGFALGPHLALLCHVELDEPSLKIWCERKNTRMSKASGPDVQNRITMLRALPERLRNLRNFSEQITRHWSRQLQREAALAE